MKTFTTLFVAWILLTFVPPGSAEEPPGLKLSAYLETYYLYDFNEPASHDRPPFIFSYNRHNEFNLNLGLVKAAYSEGRFRGNIALMAGTYANANLAAEPGVLKNVYEANTGIKLSKEKDLWIDLGIFPSHIGFESAIGKDSWVLTRSIMAENSPYYEAGAKVSYTTSDGKWLISGLILNGWQRIQHVEGNNTPAFGTQIAYKPGSNITLNSSTFVGSDKPDSSRQMRYFHDFYGIFQLTPKLGLTVGFDIGSEQKAKGSGDYNVWWTPIAIVRYAVDDRVAIAGRLEYYSDENGVIIATGTPNGFKTFGYSVNLDYAVSDQLLWRIEARGLHSEDEIFTKDSGVSSENYTLATSFAMSF